jgi:hypothetical protein
MLWNYSTSELGDEVSEKLKLSKQSIYKLIKAQEIQSIKNLEISTSKMAISTTSTVNTNQTKTMKNFLSVQNAFKSDDNFEHQQKINF